MDNLNFNEIEREIADLIGEKITLEHRLEWIYNRVQFLQKELDELRAGELK